MLAAHRRAHLWVWIAIAIVVLLIGVAGWSARRESPAAAIRIAPAPTPLRDIA